MLNQLYLCLVYQAARWRTSFHLFGQALISGMNKKGSSPVRGYCLRHPDAAGPPFRDAGAQAARESHRHPYL